MENGDRISCTITYRNKDYVLSGVVKDYIIVDRTVGPTEIKAATENIGLKRDISTSFFEKPSTRKRIDNESLTSIS